MTGAPREAYAPRDFIIVSMAAVRALDGSWEAAGCFQRISWRAEREGYWRATMQEIADEIGVSVRTAKRITEKLRDLGWITGERENKWEAILTWRVVFADESANLAPSGDQDKTAGQDREGQPGTSESDNLAPSGVPDESLSGSTPAAPSQSANLAPSFLKTEKQTDETNTVDGLRPPTTLTLVDSPDGASSTPAIGKAVREDVERLCKHLADRIESNGSKRPTVTQKWRDEARRLMDKDGKTEAHIHAVIDWCQDSSFWCSNIMSMPTLRAQYDRMRLQGEREHADRVANGNVHRVDQSHPDVARRASVLG